MTKFTRSKWLKQLRPFKRKRLSSAHTLLANAKNFQDLDSFLYFAIQRSVGEARPPRDLWRRIRRRIQS